MKYLVKSFVSWKTTDASQVWLFVCPVAVGEQKAWVQWSGLSKYLQQTSVGDVRPLAALQPQHVQLWCGEGDVCAEAHELSWPLVHMNHKNSYWKIDYFKCLGWYSGDLSGSTGVRIYSVVWVSWCLLPICFTDKHSSDLHSPAGIQGPPSKPGGSLQQCSNVQEALELLKM